MKNLPKLIISIIGCELAGILGSIFTITSIPTWYATLDKPSFAPPNWIFGPVWTLLYFLMGISFFLIWKLDGQKSTSKSSPSTEKRLSLVKKYFLAQLVLNFIWSPVFFGLKSPSLALFIIIALWVAIILTMKKFYPLSKPASYLLLPYLLWVSFATLLNAGIVFLQF